MNEQEKQKRVELLEDAQIKITEAIELIDEAVKDTEFESPCSAYIIPHLENWADGNNQYDHTAIPRLIEGILDDEQGEEDE